MEKTLVVFTYAPAGLGHIRVADALINSIPSDINFAIFSPTDRTTEIMHRLSSINVLARWLMEFIQKGIAGNLYAKIYVKYLKTHTDDLLSEFVRLVVSQNLKPRKIIIVSTHFGLAYQLGELKDLIARSVGANVSLVVQITDDSPQDLWYVDTADLIICPSHKTKRTLLDFGVRAGLRAVKMEVVPYPVSQEFAKELTATKIVNKMHQLDPTKDTPINIIFPVSGAAVGMEFFSHLIKVLHQKSSRFVFYIVCRRAPFTKLFLHRMRSRDYVKLIVSSGYREIVDMYKKVYEENVICAEITKPSEQAFKALLNVNSVGGSYLLFAEPVGRQEKDNINFLERHGIIGSSSKSTRGWILPHGSKASAELIWDLFSSGKMLAAFKNYSQKEQNDELADDGAKRFWKVVLGKI